MKRFEREYRQAAETTLVEAWRLNRLCGGSDPYPLCAWCGAITMGRPCRNCDGAAAVLRSPEPATPADGGA